MPFIPEAGSFLPFYSRMIQLSLPSLSQVGQLAYNTRIFGTDCGHDPESYAFPLPDRTDKISLTNGLHIRIPIFLQLIGRNALFWADECPSELFENNPGSKSFILADLAGRINSLRETDLLPLFLSAMVFDYITFILTFRKYINLRSKRLNNTLLKVLVRGGNIYFMWDGSSPLFTASHFALKNSTPFMINLVNVDLIIFILETSPTTWLIGISLHPTGSGNPALTSPHSRVSSLE